MAPTCLVNQTAVMQGVPQYCLVILASHALMQLHYVTCGPQKTLIWGYLAVDLEPTDTLWLPITLCKQYKLLQPYLMYLYMIWLIIIHCICIFLYVHVIQLVVAVVVVVVSMYHLKMKKDPQVRSFSHGFSSDVPYGGWGDTNRFWSHWLIVWSTWGRFQVIASLFVALQRATISLELLTLSEQYKLLEFYLMYLYKIHLIIILCICILLYVPTCYSIMIGGGGTSSRIVVLVVVDICDWIWENWQ